MTFEFHTILGALSVVIGIVSFLPYFRDIYRGTTKPHPFSWLIWGILDTTVFAAQIAKGAGAGSWATAVTLLFTFIIAGVSFKSGEKRITRVDWLCLFGGFSGIALWSLTDDPLLAVIVVTVTNSLAMIPTIRKSFTRPHEETLSMYALAVAKWVPSVLAMESWSAANWLFPVSLIFWNSAMVAILVHRRSSLAR